MVFYRKYRPQKIAELDLESVRARLGEILSSQDVPHALLFTGPRGLGKTSAARILAKSVNCLKRTSLPAGKAKEQKNLGEPCNQCDICVSVTEGRNLDVLEIDGASNRGIDEIRDLREKIKLAPASARFKVYIIDEAHMLTSEAFNALLKTLEEPPAHAIFVLCTTEPQKMPPTITSRCFQIDFQKGTEVEILRSLERVASGEKLTVEPQVFLEIARRVDGSFRDGVKILEQAALGERKISAEKIREIFGQKDFLSPQTLLSALRAKDTRESLLVIDEVAKSGGNWRVYTENILESLRKMLLEKVGIREGKEEGGEKLEIEEIRRLIGIFSRAWEEEKTTVIPQLPLEMAVVEWCGEKGGTSGFTATGPAATVKRGWDVRRPARQPQNLPTALTSAGPPRGAPRLASPVGAPRALMVGDNLENILKLWLQVLLAVKSLNHTLAGVLRSTRPKDFNGQTLIIETFYKFHQERLTDSKAQKMLEEKIGEVLGKKIKIKFILGERKITKVIPEVPKAEVRQNTEAAISEAEIAEIAQKIL